ncbi:major facilitator superfamily MFS_1 [Arcticibacter svalbardensis MN12-7]|uniref:Major facilitator superfamily MFS_1 n=1 Tax=Arcticibacter svalbardensis MN12-7 TaxID=1150600 RepID=R9GP07_9SPHI|nr:MFS transporter [Arcticibacter svalbardensis]EOR93451.1 major facilitator superfamily MFS_1 [Arcticibacter svalbardensis MN12-7]
MMDQNVSGSRKSYKWEMLAWLWLAFFLNQADRQVFSVVLPLIKVDLKLTDGELGLIASALVWTYGVLVPFAGFIGDRLSRRNIIGTSLLVWSAATLTTGLCHTLIQFIFLRGVATGGGEAFYAPAANALISEEHTNKRSFALALHQTAVYFGIILSGLIAGYIAELYGWRHAFYLFGGFGILIAVIIFLRLKKDLPAQVTEKVDVVTTAKLIFKKPTVILLTFSFACMVFVNVGYLTWMPSLLAEKFDLSLAEAGFSSMFYHHIGAFIGVISGGSLSDRFSKINPANRLVVQGVSLLLGAPFIYWIGAGETVTITYAALFMFGIFRGAYDSSIFASLYEVVKPEIKSSASGLMLMCAFLIGAFSPVLLGYLKPTLGIETGVSYLWLSYFIGALSLFTAVLFFFKKDREEIVDKI